MKALVFDRRPVRYAASAVVGRVVSGRAAGVGPLELRDVDVPELPGPDWVQVRPRLAGICGSDLATLDGTSSRWFESLVSFPFTPGHEVVVDVDAEPGADPGAGFGAGTRAVVVPVLGCAARGIDPPCTACAAGDLNRCERLAHGTLDAGLQCGYCASTGGGWSTAMVAHRSQLVAVPDGCSDEAAVMVEPAACALHAARGVGPGAVVVIGAGTLGLLTVAALADAAGAQGGREILTAAKHPHQRSLATELGADRVVAPDEIERAARGLVGTMRYDNGQLAGGVDQVVDCVGSAESLAQALRICSPGGTIHLVGMAGTTTVDLTPLWQREVALRGAYAYRREDVEGALELVERADLGRLVSATYPLDRYRDAVAHAADAGRRGAVKVAFDLRTEKEREHL